VIRWDADLTLVGGGLANGLIAYRLSQAQPGVRLLLIERGPRLGGEHTWSFSATDLSPEQRRWISPFVEHSWPGYEVRFPAYSRWINSGYCSITSPRLHDVVAASLGDRILLNSEVASIEGSELTLTDGSSIRTAAVLDGRGPSNSPSLTLRYQKFVGQVVRLGRSPGLSGPILMDATVEQLDGYRFIYVLPFEANMVLIEDTRYSDCPELQRDDYLAAIRAYAEGQSWSVKSIEREEEGVLPVALSGDIEAFWGEGDPRVARSGLRAALFHPTTGYSLPNAVRLADVLSQTTPLEVRSLVEVVRRQSMRHWHQTRFFRMLNRMLFLAGEPAQRFRVFQRFYRLPKPLIERFYAGRLNNRDQFRLLFGRPPVPVGRAISAAFSSARENTRLDQSGKSEG
jgi:lycopene beta-cyclase